MKVRVLDTDGIWRAVDNVEVDADGRLYVLNYSGTFDRVRGIKVLGVEGLYDGRLSERSAPNSGVISGDDRATTTGHGPQENR